MRIAVVVTGGLHPSGREQVVPSWLSLFGRLARSHDVHAFVLRHLPRPSTYELSGFTVHDLGRPSVPFGLTAWAQGRALMRAISAAGPFDLIHGFWGDPAGFLATRAARRLSVPSVVTCDSGEFVSLPDLEYGSQRTARGRARVREACTQATRVHVCTAFMAREVAKLGITPAIIPLGVDVPNPPGPGPPDGPPWRLLQVGSLSRVKNQALLIDAMALMAKTMDVHLDIVGEDTLGGALQTKAAALGLSDRIVFHGFVPHDRIAPIRARAHLYVQTSKHESAGVAVLEAAADGLPVIGTPVGYVADWAPESAVALDDAAPESAVNALSGLLKDTARRRRMAASALAFARSCDADRTAEALEKLHAELHILQHR